MLCPSLESQTQPTPVQTAFHIKHWKGPLDRPQLSSVHRRIQYKQGVVSYMSPLEAFATAIKFFDQQYMCLIAWSFPRVKGQIVAALSWSLIFSSSEVTLILWLAPQKGFDRLIQFWSQSQTLLHRTYKWLPLDKAHTPSFIHVYTFCPTDSAPISKSAKRNQKRREKKKVKQGVAPDPPATTSAVQKEVKKEESPPPPPPPAPVDPIAEVKRQIEEAKAAKVSHKICESKYSCCLTSILALIQWVLCTL